MITNRLELFKIFPYVVVTTVPKLIFLPTKTLDIP